LDVNPTFSPVGKCGGLQSDHSGSFEIYLKPPRRAGVKIQLTADGRAGILIPAWSPVQSAIAYYSRKPGRHLGHARARRRRHKTTDHVWLTSAWSAMQDDCVSIASTPDLGASAMGSSTICIVSSQGGSPQPLTATIYPAGLHFAPSWSPEWKTHRVPHFKYGFTASLDDLSRWRRIEAKSLSKTLGTKSLPFTLLMERVFTSPSLVRFCL